MSPLLKDDKVVIGKFGRTVGVKGQIRIYGFSEDVHQLEKYQPWYRKNHLDQWKIIDCKNIIQRNGCLLISMSGIETKEAAQALTNHDIAIDADVLPKLPAGEYYWRDLIGLTVANTDGHEFGTITELMQTGANDVLVIKLAEKQRLVPFLMNDVVKHIDMNKKRMLVDWDEDF
jgi:16S rRNA processing protein RimM